VSRDSVKANTPSELATAARGAIGQCLRVTAGEALVIVFERALAELAEAMGAAGREVGAKVETLELQGRSDEVERVERMLERCDASVFAATYGADVAVRRAMVQTRGRRRHAHMIGLNDVVVRQSLAADHVEIAELGQKLIEKTRPSSTIRVTSAAGTSLVVRTDPARRWHNEHGMLEGPGWTNLPAGEVITSPASVDGVFVPDGGVWLTDGTGIDRAAAQRLRLRFEAGRLVDADGVEDAARELLEHMDSGQNGRRVGQVAFGTNTNVVAPIGVACQDVKLRGFHLILGFSAPELTGATWNGDRLAQLLQRRATVWIDGVQVHANGRYLV
jgi:leucyl aminopeptidase (aminopeptidase T)